MDAANECMARHHRPHKKGKEGERGGGIIVYAYIDRKSNNYVPTIDHPLSGEGVDPAFSPEP